MKKKVLVLFMSAVLSVSVFGCGDSSESTPSSEIPSVSESSDNSDSSKVTQEDIPQDEFLQEPAVQEKDLPDCDYSDMGEGEMYISTAGGTSEDENIPVLFWLFWV